MFAKNRSIRVVIVATDQELRDTHYFSRLWLAARNIQLSRRRWLDAMAEAIYEFDGVILTSDGRPWPVPDIDDVMGEPGARWISLFFEAEDGAPKRDVRRWERVRLIDLYLRITRPHIARHFSR